MNSTGKPPRCLQDIQGNEVVIWVLLPILVGSWRVTRVEIR